MAQATLVLTELAGAPCAVEQPLNSHTAVRDFAHELRQPLSTIESAAYYLKMILDGEEPRAQQPVERIQQMVQQINWILSDAIHLLQTAPPRPEWINLTEFIGDQLLWLGMQQQVELDWTEGTSSPLVRMDPAHAQHMMRAILSLFRQIAGPGNPVYLSLYRDCENAVLECSCAAGQDLCAQPENLFQPFAPYLPGGSGLALASVKRIVQVHSGRIAMKSDGGVLKLEIVLASC